MKFPDVAGVREIDLFDEVIDVRSPAEFAEDHVPRAASFPVLDDEERAAHRHAVQAGLAVRIEEARRRARLAQHRPAP